MPEREFWMVWVLKRFTDNKPTMRHFDEDSAIAEAQRLAISTQQDAFVLKAIKVVKPLLNTETDDLVPIEHDPTDDLPF